MRGIKNNCLSIVGVVILAGASLVAVFRNTLLDAAGQGRGVEYMHVPTASSVQASVPGAVWWVIGIVAFFSFAVLIFKMEGNFKYELDWSVDNTVIYVDNRLQCFLVAAKSTHQIEGDMRHVPGNLPASIFFYDQVRDSRGRPTGENLYVVAFAPLFASGGENSVASARRKGLFEWEEVSGPNGETMEIVPRGAGKNWSGFLVDTYVGSKEYKYLRIKGDRPDISMPGVTRG